MRFVALATLLFSVLALAPAHARAGEVDTTTRYYGWELALADGGAWLLTIGGVPAAGIAVYALGGPTIHLLNDEPGRAAASLGVRLGAPAVGGFLADRAGGGHDSEIPAAWGGIALGVIAAQLFDDAVLGWHTERRTGLHAAVAPTRGGGMLSLSGRW